MLQYVWVWYIVERFNLTLVRHCVHDGVRWNTDPLIVHRQIFTRQIRRPRDIVPFHDRFATVFGPLTDTLTRWDRLGTERAEVVSADRCVHGAEKEDQYVATVSVHKILKLFYGQSGVLLGAVVQQIGHSCFVVWDTATHRQRYVLTHRTSFQTAHKQWKTKNITCYPQKWLFHKTRHLVLVSCFFFGLLVEKLNATVQIYFSFVRILISWNESTQSWLSDTKEKNRNFLTVPWNLLVTPFLDESKLYYCVGRKQP